MATADNYQATNEDFKHLNDGLPADMARLIAAGAFDDALRLIEAELDAGTRPELAACLRAERARILRTRRDFSVTREGIIAEMAASTGAMWMASSASLRAASTRCATTPPRCRALIARRPIAPSSMP